MFEILNKRVRCKYSDGYIYLNLHTVIRNTKDMYTQSNNVLRNDSLDIISIHVVRS